MNEQYVFLRFSFLVEDSTERCAKVASRGLSDLLVEAFKDRQTGKWVLKKPVLSWNQYGLQSYGETCEPGEITLCSQATGTQNNCAPAESYQNLIRRGGQKYKSLGIPTLFSFFDLFPLALCKIILNKFDWVI